VFQLVSAGTVLALVAVGLYRLPGRTVRHATVLVLLACVLAGVLSACTFKYTVDDTYISLRYGPPRLVPDAEIPAPSGATGELWASEVFQNEYRYLFTVCASPTYNTRVYVRTDLQLSGEALAAGYDMTRETIRANNHPGPTVR